MPRRYTDVETKAVADLKPGDQIMTRRTVTQVSLSAESITVYYDPASSETFDLAGAPTVEIVTKKTDEAGGGR